MLQIDPVFYGPSCSPLLPRNTLCPLGPGTPDETVRSALETLDPAAIVGSHALGDLDMAYCCISALWLRHGFLDESHAISQRIATPTGSYWHGFMHRREPDPSNAKYWFRRVGDHPLYERLNAETCDWLSSQPPDRDTAVLAEQSHWDPLLFVDLCEEAAGSGQPSEVICQRIADLEWHLLFDFSYRQATHQ